MIGTALKRRIGLLEQHAAAGTETTIVVTSPGQTEGDAIARWREEHNQQKGKTVLLVKSRIPQR